MIREIKSSFFTFKANTKGRWLNKPLISVMQSDFFHTDPKYCSEAIKIGAIKVNDKIVPEEYLLKNLDVITHLVHNHEPELINVPIIANEEEYIVVNKPAGLPCHPTSRYRDFCVVNAINIPVVCAHRLDIVTSGVLILYKEEFKQNLKFQLFKKKIYVAKVCGKFPDQKIVCEKIKLVPGNKSIVADDGKESLTIFKRIAYDGKYSLVECELKSGRTHQIRVHLQSINFPIINDDKYLNMETNNERIPCDYVIRGDENELERFAIEHCYGIKRSVWEVEKNYICLHAYKYYFNDKCYVAELPKWANLEDEIE